MESLVTRSSEKENIERTGAQIFVESLKAEGIDTYSAIRRLR
jgi:hypothetical protein